MYLYASVNRSAYFHPVWAFSCFSIKPIFNPFGPLVLLSKLSSSSAAFKPFWSGFKLFSLVSKQHYFALYNQGLIEPLKAARGHATYIDGKMLSVAKYSFQIYFQYSACAMTQAQLHNSLRYRS